MWRLNWLSLLLLSFEQPRRVCAPMLMLLMLMLMLMLMR